MRQVDGAFTYFNKDAKNMRNIPELGGGVIPDIAVYPTVTTRFATGREPLTLDAKVDYDPKFKTDCYASVRADFGDFELSFYISTQMANRQHMVFHGDRGFIELTVPFNSNLYEGDEVRLHNQNHSEVQVFRYSGLNQYRLEAEAFGNAVLNLKNKNAEETLGRLFSLEDSYKNQRVIDAIYASGKAGNWVKV